MNFVMKTGYFSAIRGTCQAARRKDGIKIFAGDIKKVWRLATPNLAAYFITKCERNA